MIELRDYQKEAIAQIYQAIKEGRSRIMLQLATGGGKTSVFSQIVADYVSRRSQSVLCVAHRVELINQMSQRLSSMGVPNWAQYAGGTKNLEKQVQCVSIQTLSGKTYEGPESVGLIILDECHHYNSKNTYGTLLEKYPEAIVIGVTATPIRLDGKGFEDSFEQLIVGPQVAEMQRAGYLSQYDAYAGQVADLRGIKSRGGDYQLGQLEAVCNTTTLVGDLVEHYQRIALGKRCIVFAVGIEHSLSIMREYLAAGISAEHIDGKTPKGDREAILNRLRTGETQVLCNCAIVTEGFDLPAAEVVQLARPTQSVALYLQMVGRVLRPLDGKRAIILDHGGLIEAHGFPSDHRNWTLKGVETKKSIVKQEGDGRLVVDEEATENEEKVKREIEILKEQKLYKLTEAGKAETLVLKLVAQQKYKGYKPIWVMYRLIENHRNVLTIEHFKCLEKHLGYRRGWHKHKWNEFQDSLANA